jgi:hypothetical protein
MAYYYGTGELQATWDDAPANGTLLDLHYDLDAANNAIGSSPGGFGQPFYLITLLSLRGTSLE